MNKNIRKSKCKLKKSYSTLPIDYDGQNKSLRSLNNKICSFEIFPEVLPSEAPEPSVGGDCWKKCWNFG